MMRIAALFWLVWSAFASAETLRMAVTTSFHNSGLADILLPAIKDDIGLDVQLLVVGTGQALRLGRAGDVDAILVHSKAAEQAFVAEGYGTRRRQIMYNDFVLVGPAADPAGISGAPDVTQALSAIANARATFVSRGDDSGTHRRDRALWDAADLDPTRDSPWYKEVGAGMGASLNTAAGLDAYILSDRASWLNFANKAGLALLYSGDRRLFNQYSYISVSPARHPHVDIQAATQLEEWLASERARALIDSYEIGGQQLFVFNAQDLD